MRSATLSCCLGGYLVLVAPSCWTIPGYHRRHLLRLRRPRPDGIKVETRQVKVKTSSQQRSFHFRCEIGLGSRSMGLLPIHKARQGNPLLLRTSAGSPALQGEIARKWFISGMLNTPPARHFWLLNSSRFLKVARSVQDIIRWTVNAEPPSGAWAVLKNCAPV